MRWALDSSWAGLDPRQCAYPRFSAPDTALLPRRALGLGAQRFDPGKHVGSDDAGARVMKLLHASAVIVLALAVPAALLAADKPNVDYPTGYRGWMHIKTMVIEPGHPLYEVSAGIHHIYANASALEGYKMGSFPDGSIIVFDRMEAISANNAITEGERKILGVMQKDRSRFTETGGWGFEGFVDGDPEHTVGPEGRATCFGCHGAQKDHDSVFSRWRD